MSGFMKINGVWNCEAAPMQNDREGTVPLIIAAEAWKEYAAQGHGSQSLARLNERGGFGASELAILLYDRIKRLETPEARTDRDRFNWLMTNQYVAVKMTLVNANAPGVVLMTRSAVDELMDNPKNN